MPGGRKVSCQIMRCTLPAAVEMTCVSVVSASTVGFTAVCEGLTHKDAILVSGMMSVGQGK